MAMNNRERFLAIMNFEPPDRGLLWEMGYWAETLERWYEEGLKQRENGQPLFGAGLRGGASPHNRQSATDILEQDAHGVLGLDTGIVRLPINSGPQPSFEQIIFEEDEQFLVYQDEYGVRKRINKTQVSPPQFIDWPVASRRDFYRLKEERFRPVLSERVPSSWSRLVEEYRLRDYPLAIGCYPIGFYGFLRLLMGEERLLTAFYDAPDLLHEIMGFLADFWIQLFEQALEFVRIDSAYFWQDMAYRNGPLISPIMFREFLTPCYKRLTGFLREKGVRIILVDCDGNLEALIPLFLEAGLTGVFPLEVQAGNNLLEIRRRFPRLQMLGGIDKLAIAQGQQAIDRELELKVPLLVAGGGYIPFLDHLVHPGISWADFRYYRARLRGMLCTK
jgi:hypothetical protein